MACEALLSSPSLLRYDVSYGERDLATDGEVLGEMTGAIKRSCSGECALEGGECHGMFMGFATAPAPGGGGGRPSDGMNGVCGCSASLLVFALDFAMGSSGSFVRRVDCFGGGGSNSCGTMMLGSGVAVRTALSKPGGLAN
jgi:hypothetical protein